jgi:SNF2 family DNA or RNA helicase
MAWAAVEPEGEGTSGARSALAIGCSHAEQHLAQQIPGMNFRKEDGIWRVALTWPAYTAFRTIWASQPIAEHPGLTAWAAQEWKAVQEAWRLRLALDADPAVLAEIEAIETRLSDNVLRLRPTQRGGVQWLAMMQRAGLEDPLGTGKMIQCIRALQLAAARAGKSIYVDSPLPVLVVAPGSALLTWRNELSRWAPELRVQVVTGTALRRRQALEAEADVYVMAWANVQLHTRLAPYPGQRMTRCDEHGGAAGKPAAQCEVHTKELNLREWGTIIPDEAHRMQDAKTRQTRAMWYLMQSAAYAWPCTGTPVGDNIGQLWPILHGLDPDGWPSRSKYLDLYAIKEYAWQNKGQKVLGIRPETQAAFHTAVDPVFRRIPQAIARPEMAARLDPLFRYPDMSPEQARLYKQLAKEAVAELDGADVVASNTLVKFGRMVQLAASSIEVSDGEDREGFTRQKVGLKLPSSKVADLLEYLGDNEESLVVAASSPRLIELAERKLAEAKITHCKIVGGMYPDAKDQSVRWFQDGTCRVIMITEAGGEAITLTRSNTIFFIQPDPSFRSREQKIGRVDRIGQDRPVQVIYSLAPGTVDSGLFRLGLEKEERAAQVTRDADLMRWLIAQETP